MTFNPTVPNAGQSPGLFPAQMNTDLARLKALINAEHVFNNSVAADDGVHRQMTMVGRMAPVSLPAGTNGMYSAQSFGSTFSPYYYDGVTNVQLAPVLARITWSNVPAALGTPYNATIDVSSTATNVKINFTTTLPSLDVEFSLNCIEPSNNLVVGKVVSFSTSQMVINFQNQNNTKISNYTRGSLIIFGIL